MPRWPILSKDRESGFSWAILEVTYLLMKSFFEKSRHYFPNVLNQRARRRADVTSACPAKSSRKSRSWDKHVILGCLGFETQELIVDSTNST